MTFFESIKQGNSRIVKLFGRTFYKTETQYNTRTQNLLGSFMSSYKTIDADNNTEKLLKVFGYPVCRWTADENFKNTYLFGRLIRSIDIKKRYAARYKKYIKGYDNIIILNANSGETYLFFTYVLTPFLKKIRAKKPLFIASKKYHIDLINMLCPEIPYCCIPKIKVLNHTKMETDGQTFYTIFTREYFIQVEKDIKSSPLNTAHYFKSILKELNINEKELSFRKIQISDEIKESAVKKAKAAGLNLENFIFAAPEAASCEECSSNFWADLTKEAKKQGYDVFFNIAYKDTKIEAAEYKTCTLTIAEAFALAKMAKGIAALRSGLAECLLQTGVPIFCLYTPFKNRYIFNDMNVEHVMSGYGLNRLPEINSRELYEFDMSYCIKSDVIKSILQN